MQNAKQINTMATVFDEFYTELTSRNRHFISKDLQHKLRSFKILIAGCGSTGGACIEALARVGVCHFYLADNGRFDLSNLNRQHARLENLNQNKAQFHAKEIAHINPYSHVKFSDQGINASNVDEFVSQSDLIFDAIDVTTREGIEAKILLHQKAHENKKPLLTALDMGFLQKGFSYDYRLSGIKPLNGKSSAIAKATHPIASLFQILPFHKTPTHCYPLVLDLLEGKSDFASQLGCTSDALSAVIVPSVLRFVDTGELVKGWSLDLYPLRHSLSRRLKNWFRDVRLRGQILKILNQHFKS